MRLASSRATSCTAAFSERDERDRRACGEQIEAVNASPITLNGRSLPAIRFLPDGTVDETSLRTVRLATRSGETLWLVQATNHLSYAITDDYR